MNADGKTAVANGERYRTVLQQFYADLAQEVTQNQLKMGWFSHDAVIAVSTKQHW